MKKILLASSVLLIVIFGVTYHLQPQTFTDQITDQGIVLKHGDTSDLLGARDVFVYREKGTFYMTYDGTGVDRWTVNEATSSDGIRWNKLGIVLDRGVVGSPDSATADYGTIYKTPTGYDMYYLGSPNQSADSAHVPSFPYYTLKAHAISPTGPWVKDAGNVLATNGYSSVTASPGPILKEGNQYLMFFSAATIQNGQVLRTLSIARSSSPDGPWTEDTQPILPATEQIENISLYKQADTWYLFTNHVTQQYGREYTDAIWMYWSKDLNHWNVHDKRAIVTGQTSSWSHTVIGLPSVMPVGDKLYIYYDGKTTGLDSTNPTNDHIGRDIGVATLQLPIATR